MSPTSRFALFVISQCFFVHVHSKAQYVMPVSTGLKMSIPWDIANIFIRPVSSVIGVVIGFGLLYILFFGVITSPFGYFFGIPSRKYVTGASTSAKPRLFKSENLIDKLQHIDFTPSERDVFRWMDLDDFEIKECRFLVLCYTHGVMAYLPKRLFPYYRIFSGKLADLPTDYRRAIIRGLNSRESCDDIYGRCPQSGFSLLVKTVLKLLPENVKQDFRKRKGPMYL